ncbi:MAG: DUF4097 family beta strand repeat protein [Saprospiraceae bacterium]|nr:DUF4097 family beta strand repeat protein [Saprospiraceae bacterium]
MKKIYICLLMLLTISLGAQETTEETHTIPLSNPGQAGMLEVDIQNGNITVETHSGQDVIVTLTGHNGKEKEKDDTNKYGLKKVSNNVMETEITEENNYVEIDGGYKGRMDVHVMVPENFSLELDSHHNSDIMVKNVKGTIEANSHHGEITMENISGSVVADTHHGAIKVDFASIDNDKPMAFSTYHGNVEVTLPASSSFNPKVKSSRGDVYTDFEIDLRPVSSEGKNKGKYKIGGGWLQGKVGSGGQEMMMNSYHGDIIIRKA